MVPSRHYLPFNVGPVYNYVMHGYHLRYAFLLVHLMHIQRLSSVVVVAQQQQEVKVVEGEP